MIRVLQLGTCGPLYGAERWILALVRHLDPAQIESHIAVIADSPGVEVALYDAALAAGMAAYCLNAPGRFNMAAVNLLRDLITQHRIDVVHSHGYKPDLVALLAVIGTSAKVVATPHGWSHDADWKLRAYEWFDRRLFRLCHAVAPLSEDLARGLGGGTSFRRKVHLIPNGVDLHEVDDAGPVPDEMARLRQNGPVIGYAGQLIARKDLSTLLHAFAAWGRSDASLVLVGEGDQRAELQALAASLGIEARVHFIGFRPDRLEWMRGFHLFVLPSRVEGIPRCLMEAMALHVPVIATDIPGTRDLISHEQTGLLFAPGDVAGLTRQFDQALQGAYVNSARSRIENRFSARAMAQGYEALFANLVR